MRQLHASGKVIPVYLDLQDLASSPELFTQRYVGLSCFWAVDHGEGPADPYLSATDLMQTNAGSLSVVTRTARRSSTRWAGKRLTTLLYSTSLSTFPERLAEALGRPLMLSFLDKFPELLTLGSFPGVGDPLNTSALRCSVNPGLLMSSPVQPSARTEHIVQDHQSPLFLQFRALELHPFAPEDTQALTEKLVGRLSPAAPAAIHTYTFGHPFYVHCAG